MPSENKITRVNQPENVTLFPSLRELWEYRDALIQVIRRDFMARYTQSVLGVIWIIVTPIVTMIVYTFVFKRVADVPSYNIPYPVFSFAALVPWTYFAKSLTLGTRSILQNRQLVTDVYIPRILLPIAVQLTNAIDLFVNFFIFLLLMLLFGFTPTLNSLVVILFMIQLLVLSTGISFFLSALQVRYRDISSLVTYIVQVLVFLSPVAYPTEIIDSNLKVLYSLNPLVGLLDGWRWAMLGIDTFDPFAITISVVVTVSIFILGLTYFMKAEATFTDWI